MKTFLKIICGVLLLLILLLVGAGLWLDSPANRHAILQRAVTELADKLQTNVEIDSVDVNLWQGTLDIYALRIDDQQQRRMLAIDTVAVRLGIKELLERRICVRYADIDGLELMLCKDSTGVANYQFVLDAFKKDKKSGAKMKFDLNIEEASLDRVHASINGQEVWLGALTAKGNMQKMQLSLSDVIYRWSKMRKRGMQANECHLSHAAIVATMNKEDTTGTAHVLIDSVFYTSNIDAPHKRTGKPKRGYFDEGHMKAAAYVELDVPYWCKDSATVVLNHLAARDHASGLNIDTVTLSAGINRKQVSVRDIHIRLTDSRFDIPTAAIVFPDSVNPLTYSTGTIDGTVILTDIARPFAPFALQKFTMPLEVNAEMEGDTATIRFHKAHVFTKDGRFTVNADGFVTGLKKKTDLNVHFDVRNMRAANNKVFDIIHQFPVKKFMMTQLKQLGTIGFNGNLNVHFKREQIDGILTTAAGPIVVELDIDDLNKYLHGKVRTKTFNLGKAVEMKFLGEIDCRASFSFDISKPRTALIRRRNGGKLPIGSVDATVNAVHFKKLTVKNVSASIKSDGALAQGQIFSPHKQVDLSCDFTFTSTDSISKMKIKPHATIHAVEKIKEKRAERKEKRAEKKAQREAAEAAGDSVALAKKKKRNIFKRNMDKE